MAPDHDGVFLDHGAGSAIQVEAIAALHGLERVSALGMPGIILEADATNLGLTSSDLGQQSHKLHRR